MTEQDITPFSDRLKSAQTGHDDPLGSSDKGVHAPCSLRVEWRHRGLSMAPDAVKAWTAQAAAPRALGGILCCAMSFSPWSALALLLASFQRVDGATPMHLTYGSGGLSFFCPDPVLCKGHVAVTFRAVSTLRAACEMARSVLCGEVAEWSKVPHSKCGVLARVPWVRIPPSPP